MTAEGIAHRIVREHLAGGEMRPGSEIAIRIDQTLTQDASGTLADLQFEALGLPRVRNELAVSYVDHNMLQSSFENADDHRFLRTFAARYGLLYSRPGNGICHQVHLERFSAPGKTLLGADSHTPTSGGMGMIALGAGGLDVAVAMAGEPFHLAMPQIVAVTLEGRMPAWVSAKDIVLELLRRLSVKGGVGKIFEYRGSGLDTLSVPERATIANMGAELGATTSIFPSDDLTLRYLRAQGRGDAWTRIVADDGAAYDDEIEIDLGALEPLIALPGRPDRVVPVREVAGRPIEQVTVGSCTNSSYRDLLVVAKVLEGHVVHPTVSLTVTPGSRQAFLMAEVSGAVENFIEAGARVLESACGPCIGMGQAPASRSASLRSFNRNFTGRSGTADAEVYLASPEVCAATAITGKVTDPRSLGTYPAVDPIPPKYVIDDRMIVTPPADGSGVEVLRGPNIMPLPQLGPLPDRIEGPVLIAVGDDVTTDDILPAGAEVLPLRSNIPSISRFAFVRVDREFPLRARAAGQGIVVGGRNYGQGSSREHAALVPRYLGVAAVAAVSFARIHRANLVNFGVLPLTFADPADRARLAQGETITIEGLRDAIASGRAELRIRRLGGDDVAVRADLSPREREIVLAGGLLSVVRARVTGGMGPKTAGAIGLATPAD